MRNASLKRWKLTLKPSLPFLQQRHASMRKTKVKRPEKEMATTARDDDQDSSLSGAPSAGGNTENTDIRGEEEDFSMQVCT